MAMNAAVRDEADDVERVLATGATAHAGNERRIVEEVTLVDASIDSGEVLIYNPPRAQVHVANFGVPHLTGRKTDRLARRDEGCVRIPLQQLVKCRSSSESDRVVIPILSKPPTVKDDQNEGWLGLWHGAIRSGSG